MAETIRDVVIRISLQQVNNKLTTPDYSSYDKALKSLQDQINEINTAQKNAASAATTTAAESVRAVEEVIEVQKERVEATKEVETVEKKLTETVLDNLKKTQEAQEEQAKAEDELSEKRKKLLEDFEEQQKKFSESSLKTLDSAKTLGEGVLTLVRGSVLLGASEADVQKWLKSISQVQASFDFFKGGIETTKGLIEGYQHLNVAVAAYTTTQAAATAAGTSFTVMTVAKTVALKAATVAQVAYNAAAMANPLTAVAAGLVTTTALIYGYSRATRDATQSTLDFNESGFGEDPSREKYARERAWQREDSNRQNEIQHQKNLLEIRRNNLSIQEQIALIEKEQSKNFGFQESKETMKQWIQSQWGGGKVARDRQREVALDLQDFLKLEIQAEQRKLDLIEQQGAAQIAASQDALKNARTTLDVINQQLATEKARKETLQESIGRLSPLQRRELEQLREKAESGQDLSRWELGRLESLVGTHVKDYTSEQYRKMGQGSEDLLAPFTTQQQLKVQGLEGQRDYYGKAIQELERQVKEAQEERQDQMKKLIDIINQSLNESEQTRRLIRDLQNKVQQTNAGRKSFR